MDIFLEVTPHILNWTEVGALCWTLDEVHTGLLEIVLHQERRMCSGVVMLEDEATTQTMFFFIHDSFHLHKISSSSTALKYSHSIILPPSFFAG